MLPLFSHRTDRFSGVDEVAWCHEYFVPGKAYIPCYCAVFMLYNDFVAITGEMVRFIERVVLCDLNYLSGSDGVYGVRLIRQP